jgi:hypothetical protein
MSGAFSAVIVIVGLQQLVLTLVMLVILIFRPNVIIGGRKSCRKTVLSPRQTVEQREPGPVVERAPHSLDQRPAGVEPKRARLDQDDRQGVTAMIVDGGLQFRQAVGRDREEPLGAIDRASNPGAISADGSIEHWSGSRHSVPPRRRKTPTAARPAASPCFLAIYPMPASGHARARQQL